jgi:hypothetical protein
MWFINNDWHYPSRTRLKTGENSSKHNFSHVHFIFATRLVRKRWEKKKNPESLRAVSIQ